MRIFTRIFDYIGAALFFGILILLLFFSNIRYACNKTFLISNFWILTGFLLVAVLVYVFRAFACTRKLSRPKMDYDKIVKLCMLILPFVQVYISYNIFFETGWDPGTRIIPAARALLAGNKEIFQTDYFSTYPNNMLLIVLFYSILQINEWVGVFTGADQLMAIVLCNCAIASVSCFLVYRVGTQLLEKKFAFIGFLFAIVLFGTSPWMVICYSDSIALLFPILMVYIYCHQKLNRYIKYPLIGLLGYFGYSIKPQVGILLIALLIMEALKFIAAFNVKRFYRGIKVAAVSVLCVGILAGSLGAVYHSLGIQLDPNRKFGATHFFMMGLNEKRLGVYAKEDVQASRDCETPQARQEMNIAVAKERLSHYGIVGYAKLLSRKMLTNYNDGTFAWGCEGNFRMKECEDRNTWSSPVLKHIFYYRWNYNFVYATVVHVAWIILLSLICFLTVAKLFWKKKTQPTIYYVLLLSVLGLTAFQLLFEARARYLYLYLPIYILLGMYGLAALSPCCQKCRTHIALRRQKKGCGEKKSESI